MEKLKEKFSSSLKNPNLEIPDTLQELFARSGASGKVLCDPHGAKGNVTSRMSSLVRGPTWPCS